MVLPPPPEYTFVRHTLSKYFPDVHTRSYIEGAKLDVAGSSITSTLNFSFGGVLRKIYVATSGSIDGDYFNVSGSNRAEAYATNILIPPNNLGLVLPLELGEKFTGSSNSIYFSFFPTGSTTNKAYIYYSFVRD